ncbi:MAG TPA: GAF domain-containing protein [Thermoanaerobaculia bacterium]
MPSTIDMAARFASVIAAQHEILAAAADPEKVMSVAVERTRDLTRAAGAAITLREGGRHVIRAGTGLAAGRTGVDVTDELRGEATSSKQVIFCENAELDARSDATVTSAIGIRSLVIAPLLGKDGAFGTIESYGSRPNAFDDFDAYTLELLAGMIAGALLLAHELRERQISEERYRLLFEKNVAGVFRTTVDGDILDCNDAFVEYLGYASREELLSRKSWDLYPERADRESFLARLGSEQVMTNVRMKMKRKDGTPVNSVVNVSFIPGANGEAQLLGTLVEAMPER